MIRPTTDDTAVVLSDVWQEFLEVDSVKPGDRILELGGNSLIATMIANRIELAWGFRPSMENLLTQTFDELSALCGRRRAE
ncbi:phosphopantetheine-binding protein [Streptomyces sp. NPDC059970]|uniref:phosphopantetheine-binding protein n=1 Tax=Streptomyces sp. NPDC059970 TaxID=3347019 RepID=UPI00369AC40F